MVSLVKSVAYNSVTLLWIGYLRQEGETVPVLNVGPVHRLNLALATPNAVAGNDESFIVWVEQAVERVLARHSWPASDAEGAQIVGRKPGPEESN
jgi:hypothetical protein